MPDCARVALDDEGAVRRTLRRIVEQRVPRRQMRAERLAAQQQRAVARALDPGQVPAPSSAVASPVVPLSTVPLIR